MPKINHVNSILLILPCLIISACSETVVKDDPSSTSTGNAAATLPTPLLSTLEQDLESSEMQGALSLGTQPDSELILAEQAISTTLEISAEDTHQSDTDQYPADSMSEATLVSRTDDTPDSALDIEQTTDTVDILAGGAGDTVAETISESATTGVDSSQNMQASEAPMTVSGQTDVMATDNEGAVDTANVNVDTDTTLPNENEPQEPQEPQVTITPGSEQLNDPDSELTESVSDTTEQVSASGESLSAQVQPATGVSNAAVDCQKTVPCHWTSEDSQFTVSVTNADNISSVGNLAIQFSISARHDSQVSIARAEHALDTTGKGFEPIGQTLGDGNGVTAQTMVAGEKLEGSLSFDDASQDTALAEWAVALIDGGMIRSARFTNIPVGPLTTRPTECNNTLPCVWESPDEQVKITLLSVGNISTGNRLTVNFSVETMTNTTVALDAGSSAVGTDGTRFSSRTHTLAGQTAYENVVADTRAFALLAGSFYFFKSTAAPDSLQDLSLIIYEDRPVPRWNPRFTAVPVF